MKLNKIEFRHLMYSLLRVVKLATKYNLLSKKVLQTTTLSSIISFTVFQMLTAFIIFYFTLVKFDFETPNLLNTIPKILTSLGSF